MGNHQATFLRIETISDGITFQYNVSSEERRKLCQQHNGKVNGNGGTVAIYDQARTYTLLKFRFPGNTKAYSIDIRKQIKTLTGRKTLSKKLIGLMNDNFPETFDVKEVNGVWCLADKDILSNILEAIGYLKK